MYDGAIIYKLYLIMYLYFSCILVNKEISNFGLLVVITGLNMAPKPVFMVEEGNPKI